MSLLLRILGRVALGLGWVAFVVLAVLYLAEETGLLTHLTRNWIASHLGALGADLEIEHVKLRWFRPAVDLYSVRLGRDGEMVLLRQARVSPEAFNGRGFALSSIEVNGGHVRLSPALSNGISSTFHGEQTSDGWTRAIDGLPLVRVRGLAVDIDTRRWDRLPIGQVDLDVRADAGPRLIMSGRMVPTLAAKADESGEIYLTGEISPAGEVELRAAATGVPLSTEYLPVDTELERVRPFQPRGVLEVEAQASFDLWQAKLPHASLRLALSNGSCVAAQGRQRFDRLRIEVESTYEPTDAGEIGSPGAWHARARYSGEWDGRSFVGRAWHGTGFERDRIAKAWVHVPRLSLSHALIDLLGETPALNEHWQALDSRGETPAWIGVQCSSDWSVLQPAAGCVEVGAELDLAQAAGLTFRGWPVHATRRLEQGFPLPLDQVSGRVIFGLHPRRDRPAIVGLVDLAGQHAGDTIRAAGWIASHERDAPATSPGHGYAEYDLALSSGRLAVDDSLRSALTGLAAVVNPASTWQAFNPTGGSVSVDLRLARRIDLNYASTDLRLGLDDVALTWKDLPVPVSRTRAQLRFRSDGKHDGALTFSAQGELRTAKRLGLDISFRTDPNTPPTVQGKSLDEMFSTDVTVERVSLTGDDRKILVARYPDIGAVMDPMSPRGFADIHYSRSRARAGAPVITSAEVTPREPVQLTPEEFKMVTSEVRGRVLVGTVEDPPRTGDEATTPPLPPRIETRIMPLVGTWDQRVLVALTASFPEKVLEIYGAGINPSSKSLLGSLSRAIQKPGDSSAVDLTALSVEGFFDLRGRIQLAPEGQPEAEKSYRVFLRNNSLVRSGNFRLDGLQGVLDSHDEVWHGARISGRLADTPVALANTRFTTTANGYELTTELRAENLPLDREHLRWFMDAETLETLLTDLRLSGSFDIEDGRLSISGPRQGEGRLLISGRVTPKDMFIQLGLPLSIRSASAVIEKLILESGKMRAFVRLEDLYGTVADRELGPANLLLTYVEPRLSLENLNGQFERGEIQALGQGAVREETAFSIDLVEPFPFHLALDLRNVAVEGLLRGLFPTNVATKGQTNCQLLLTGDTENLLEIKGSGSILVRSSRLWSVPVFRALFSRLGLDDTAVFDSMAANLRVENGTIHLHDIAVHSPLLQLAGSGTIDFDGRLKQDLEVRYDLVDRLGPLTRMLYAIQNGLLSISIRGDLSRPEVILKNPVTRLFGGSNAKPSLPLPGYAPLPPRF